MSNSELEHENEVLKLKLRKLELLKKRDEENTRLKREFPWLYLHKLYQWQREVLECTNKKQILVSANQVGKVQAFSTLIPTPSGYKKLGDLKVGDQVIGDDGIPCNVVAIPWEGVDDYYEITFDDGTTVEAGQSHLWRCKGSAQRFERIKKDEFHTFGQWILKTTKQIYEDGLYGSSKHKPVNRFVLPYVEPVQYPEIECFDPYALGVLLGDGSLVRSSIVVTNPIKEIANYFEVMFQSANRWLKDKNCYNIRLPSATCVAQLDSMGLIGTYSHNKFIPKKYMFASLKQRLELLQGLMDTDGTINPEGDSIEFNTASSQLADDVIELIFSLGGTCKRNIRQAFYWHNGERKQGLDSHRIRIKLRPGMCPFKLEHNKIKRWSMLEGKVRYKHERVIRSIKPIGQRAGRCITVSSTNSCYVSGSNYVVTHNSSIAIIKTIEWATNKELWPKIFPISYGIQGHPRSFWYLYPSLKIATSEFEEKWKPLMPPQDHPVNGWEVKYRGRDTDYVRFKCGTYIRFKTYMQNIHLLQSGTTDLVVCDEEVPIEVLPELQMRVQASNGYMLFVFTATRGQTFWRKVVEERTEWRDAQVWQVSLYNSQKFEDGSESQWTNRRISQAIANCTSDAQVQRRIFGRFIRDEGLRFEVWDRARNTMEYESLSPEWKYYVGVDYGSGGNGGHPSAIAVLAVNSDMTQARVVGMWRGDKLTTTAEDVVNKIQEMTAYIKDDDLIWVRYDYSATDIGTIAIRRGLAKIQKADKGRDVGLATIQSLLKNGALKVCTYNDKAMLAGIADNHMETYKLIEEFENLGIDDSKTVAEDDCCDALRYSLNGIPFDWETIGAVKVSLAPEPVVSETDQRRGLFEAFTGPTDLIAGEFDFWNNLLEDG